MSFDICLKNVGRFVFDSKIKIVFDLPKKCRLSSICFQKDIVLICLIGHNLTSFFCFFNFFPGGMGGLK